MADSAASGTFHFIWNRVANILSSRETDPVNVKTDVNFRRAQAGRPYNELPRPDLEVPSFMLLEY